jgi:hypothetical protein
LENSDPAIQQAREDNFILRRGYSPLCQSASRVKLIHGLSSTSKAEDLWITRLGTAYCQRIPFSLIVVALRAVQNSSHLITTLVQVGFLNRYLAC